MYLYFKKEEKIEGCLANKASDLKSLPACTPQSKKNQFSGSVMKSHLPAPTGGNKNGKIRALTLAGGITACRHLS
jgi:hypothetical protein